MWCGNIIEFLEKSPNNILTLDNFLHFDLALCLNKVHELATLVWKSWVIHTYILTYYHLIFNSKTLSLYSCKHFSNTFFTTTFLSWEKYSDVVWYTLTNHQIQSIVGTELFSFNSRSVHIRERNFGHFSKKIRSWMWMELQSLFPCELNENLCSYFQFFL